MTDRFEKSTFIEIKVLMAVANEDGSIYVADALEDDEGKVWIVPHWLESPSQGLRFPARIILMNNLQHQKTEDRGCSYLLNYPIPRGILDGDPRTPKIGYVVIEEPGIALKSNTQLH